MNISRRSFLFGSVVAARGAWGQSNSIRVPSGADLRPTNAIDLIVGSFDHVDIVGFGEIHHLQNQADFLVQLLKAPSCSRVVKDVVLEWGKSLYQDVMDRYTAGESVDPKILQQVWRNTTAVGAPESPIYEQIFSAIRDVNRSRPHSQRLRALLGDPPIDWAKVKTGSEFSRFDEKRDSYFAEVIVKNVLKKGRKALAVFGTGHLTRQPRASVLVQILEQQYRAKVFVITPHRGFGSQNNAIEGRFARWPVPSAALLKGTWLGALDASLYFHDIRTLLEPLVANPFEGIRLEDTVDAFLYLGPSDSLRYTQSPESTYEGEYGRERQRRLRIFEELIENRKKTARQAPR
jgi:hypothetical protein